MKTVKSLVIKFYIVCIRVFVIFYSAISYRIAKQNTPEINNSLIILCLAKNNAKQLKTTLKRFSMIQQYFSDFKVLVYENNSTDSTKEVLKNAKEIYSFLEYFSFDYTKDELEKIATVKELPFMKQCRIQHISYGRNYLCSVVKKSYNTFNNVLVFDSDTYYFNPYIIVQKVALFIKKNYNVLSVNGLTKRFEYRDAYAFRSTKYPYGPEFLGEYWWKNVVTKIQQRYHKKEIIPVYSAFGGAALYKTKEYTTVKYSALHTKKSIEMQKVIHKANKDFDISNINPTFQPINNTKYTAPIVCEHVPFHYELYEQGITGQYVDTTWKMLFLD